MGERDADQTLRGGRAAIQADRAAVRRIADAHRGDAGLAGQFDRQRVRAMCHHDALPLAAMQLRRARSGAFDADIRAGEYGAVRYAVQVMRQARDAVGIDAPQARPRQALRQAPRVFPAKALDAQAVLAPTFPFNGVHSAFRIHAALLR
ncbi:hypothetical protein D3C71_1456280 [compost metagenome]